MNPVQVNPPVVLRKMTSIGTAKLLPRSSGRISTGLPYFSPCFSRFEPSRSGCHPTTSETMKPSMRRAPGALSLTVDL
jgi:hypothetical protein